MNNSSIFAAQFAAASLNSLVASFNHEVGNHGWCSARASYDHALIAEFLRRGINVSAIYDGSSISFAKPVSLQDNTLIICKLFKSDDTVCSWYHRTFFKSKKYFCFNPLEFEGY